MKLICVILLVAHSTAMPIEEASPFVHKLPTHSRCQAMCPQCKENPPAPCKCDDKCWPGQGVDNTIDETCNCFASLGFCDKGEEPVYIPGEKCPSCWPANNTACACFAAVGFCDPPAKLPTTSRCATLCPKCTSPKCKCDACWPGKSLNETTDHTCECFAKLGFCAAGTKPVYTPGNKCPSCWDPDNNACDCFAAIGFCDASPKRAPVELATFDGAKQTTFEWQTVNDPVMGGSSFSNFTVDSARKLGVWKGEVKIVSFLHAPGFCNLQAPGMGHTAEFPSVVGTSGVVLRARAAGGVLRSFAAMISTKGARHGAIFKKTGVYNAFYNLTGTMGDVHLPWSAFKCTYRGEPVSWCPDIATQLDKFTNIGLGTAFPGKAGKFDVEIQSIAAQ